jgi:dipeptidyl aminopeptidase/acylaminoacyl peptidase
LIGVLFLLAGFSDAQSPAKEKADPDFLKPALPKRIVYSTPGMEKIKARKDIVWKRVDGAELKLDVYSPPKQKRGQSLPAIIFIHGRPIPDNLLTEPKEWGVFTSYGQLAAASGFIGVTFNHPPGPRFHCLDASGQSRVAQKRKHDTNRSRCSD